MCRRTKVLVLLTVVSAAVVGFAASAANQAPVARLSAYRTGATGYAVAYDASGSVDADGQIARFQWVFGDGTTGSGPAVTHAYSAAGPFSVTLVVWDNVGASAFVMQTVDVAALGFGPAAVSLPANASNGEIPVGPGVGSRAPEIALPGIGSDTVTLSSYLGRPVLIEFWLSTCSGCIASTPQLEVYRSTYAAAGLVVMLVVLDRHPSQATTFLRQQHHYSDFVLAWESDSSRPTVTLYEVPGTPYAFFIDAAGIVRYAGRPDGLSDALITDWIKTS